MQPQDTTQPQYITLGRFARNLTGQTFGRLTALGPIERTKHGRIKWLCQCVCGNKTEVRSSHLLRGAIASCGCLALEKLVASHTRHGLFGTSIYSRWSSIIQRCANQNDRNYANYGGRGIAVCDEWKESFEAFHAHVSSLPNFGKKGYTLDRSNNSLGYFPGNVRWITQKEQTRNTRSNVNLTYNGKTQCVSAWAEELGMNPIKLAKRLRRGWSLERALTTL